MPVLFHLSCSVRSCIPPPPQTGNSTKPTGAIARAAARLAGAATSSLIESSSPDQVHFSLVVICAFYPSIRWLLQESGPDHLTSSLLPYEHNTHSDKSDKESNITPSPVPRQAPLVSSSSSPRFSTCCLTSQKPRSQPPWPRSASPRLSRLWPRTRGTGSWAPPPVSYRTVRQSQPQCM